MFCLTIEQSRVESTASRESKHAARLCEVAGLT